jgi:hypothetical protein
LPRFQGSPTTIGTLLSIRIAFLRRLAGPFIAFCAIGLTFADCGSASTTAAPLPPACYQPLPGAPGIAGASAIEYTTGKALTNELNDFQTLRVRWLRMDITWSDVQKGGPTSYDWSNDDPPIKGALSRGISVDGNIAYTPSWARAPGTSDDKYPPTNPDTYASFAAATARRYAPMGVHTWEIWNEENNPGFWKPAPNARQYAVLLEKASAAIKGVDPSATVIAGGLSGTEPGGLDPVSFLSDLYAAGAGGSFDVVADHPYTYPDMPSDSSAWAEMGSSDPSLRSVMTAHGDSAKKISVTEYGAPTNGAVSDAVQANMITQAFQLLGSAPWAGPLFVYSYKDLGTDTSTDDDFFGLVRFDGSVKPAWGAFQQAASAFIASCSRTPTTSATTPSTAPSATAPPTSAPPTTAPSAALQRSVGRSRPPAGRPVGTPLLAVSAVALSALALGRSRWRRRASL